MSKFRLHFNGYSFHWGRLSWIIGQLNEINDKLDKIVRGLDLSKEDASVKDMTKQVQTAQSDLPPVK